jgi:hypothetical protein
MDAIVPVPILSSRSAADQSFSALWRRAEECARTNLLKLQHSLRGGLLFGTGLAISGRVESVKAGERPHPNAG